MLYPLMHGRLEAKATTTFSDSLKLHSSRTNYQAYKWKYYLQQHPPIPLPDGNCQEQDANGAISIKWSTVQSGPDKITWDDAL